MHNSSKFLISLWKFSRPHTIIGSVLSLCTLYIMACNGQNLTAHIGSLLIVIIAGLACNIFIVGINQIEDIELDKINKPHLPLASGELSITQAKKIVQYCIVICLVGSVLISFFLVGISIVILFIGWAYSVPPFKLRNNHLPAALAIVSVRGVIVNLGLFTAFNLKINQSLNIPFPLVLLTLFVIAFSLVIAWYKDLPDTTGDAQFKIKTLSILYHPKWVLRLGATVISIAYVVVIYLLNQKETFDIGITNHKLINDRLLIGHIVLFVLFLLNLAFVKANEKESVRKFYMRFWLFFFAEYLLFIFAYLA